MRGEVLFEKMTGISDEFIAEAALVAPVGVAAPKKKPVASLSRVLNSGWGVACICFIVAIAAVVGMVAWGRMGEITTPGSDPAVRFAFSYEMTDNNGSAWSGTAMPGDMVNVRTTIVNQGKPFKSYGFHAHAQFVLQEDNSIIIEGVYPLIDAPKETIETNRVGTCFFSFQIPANATPGMYDLVLSYDGEKQVFGGVLTVEESTEDPSAQFEFDYTMQDAEGNVHDGFVRPGEFFSVLTTVTNKGKSFRCVEWEYFANACFVLHGDETVRIAGDYAIPDSATPMIKTVENGESGLQRIMFTLPQSTVPGVYDLVLSYGGYSQTFERVLTVAEPTVIAPAVLYNLTMPIGSDWLYEPIDEAYVDGEEVTVRIQFATDVGTLFFLNGEVINAVTGDDQLGYWEYSFIMPQKDSEIIFRTYDGTAPYSEMIAHCIRYKPYSVSEEQFHYYGEFGDGVMVALLNNDPTGNRKTEVSGCTFKTTEPHVFMVYHDGSLYTLTSAYEQKLLTEHDLIQLANTHREEFFFLYADDE